MRTTRSPTAVVLGARYGLAFEFASRLHREQRRKGSEVPYLTHLMSVSALVLEYGGSEEQAIAGLLHDSIEDQSHGAPDALRADIRRQFGAEVLRIVEGCTDTDESPKPPWEERKARYIEHLWTTTPDIALVSACDKLHNARTMLSDFLLVGDAIWGRFQRGRDAQLGYLSACAAALEHNIPGNLHSELCAVIATLDAESDPDWDEEQGWGCDHTSDSCPSCSPDAVEVQSNPRA